MSYHDILIFFLSLFFCMYMVIFYHTEVERECNKAGLEYAHKVASACQDSVEQTIGRNVDLRCRIGACEDKKLLWKSDVIREEAVSVFIQALGMQLGQNANNPSSYHFLEFQTPLLCMVDYDGFYVAYPDKAGENRQMTDETKTIHNITEKNYWTEQLGQYRIRYFLADEVEIKDTDGSVKRGDRELLAAEYPESIFGFLKNKEEFEERKNNCVIAALEKVCNTYVNQYNQWTNEGQGEYVITLSRKKGETWCGLVDDPCILGFVQGKTRHLRGQHYSNYGFAIYEMGEPLFYKWQLSQ